MKRSYFAAQLVAACFALLPLTYAGAVRADHLPYKLLAQGKPETVLAGIDLKSATLSQVVRLYGSPQRQKTVPNNPAWIGYVWELPGARLEIDTEDGTDDRRVSSVYVEGTSTGTVGSTGMGLRLHDDAKKIRRVYGNRFEVIEPRPGAIARMEFSGVTSAVKRVTYQWRSDDFTLVIGLDDHEIVQAMWLQLPECYPDGCE